MYDMTLTTSLFPEQTDAEILEETVGDRLRLVAEAHPGQEALVEVSEAGETGRRWTYARLLADSERLALALASRFAPGERVAIWAPNSPEWVLMQYACALAGITLVTANPAFQARELRYVLEKSGAVALFQEREYRGNPMERIGAEASRGLEDLRETVDLQDPVALFAHGRRPALLPPVRPGDET